MAVYERVPDVETSSSNSLLEEKSSADDDHLYSKSTDRPRNNEHNDQKHSNRVYILMAFSAFIGACLSFAASSMLAVVALRQPQLEVVCHYPDQERGGTGGHDPLGVLSPGFAVDNMPVASELNGLVPTCKYSTTCLFAFQPPASS